MRHSVSISLSDGIFKKLKTLCKQENANWSEIVRKALREYFVKAEFERLRRIAAIESARRGIHLTEEEIFDRVS
jgi:predicted transcriptional regulator